jgi:hypothetical protein
VKEHARQRPVTERKRSQNPKEPLFRPFHPNGCRIFENAPKTGVTQYLPLLDISRKWRATSISIAKRLR